MKKFLAMLLVCVSALSVLAFGGCGLLSDTLTGISGNENGNSESESGGNENGGTVSYEVSEDEWRAAFGTDRMLNFTMTETVEDDYIPYSEHNIAKFALTDNASYISGNVYGYSEINDEGEEETEETYITYTSSYVERVSKYYRKGTTQWYGNKSSGSVSPDDISSYTISSWFVDFLSVNTSLDVDMCDAYGYFAYVNGAYVYAEDEDSTTVCTVTIKFANGYVSSISYELNFTNEYFIDTVTFSDYGTTTVTVPNEYTYDYYLANNA